MSQPANSILNSIQVPLPDEPLELSPAPVAVKKAASRRQRRGDAWQQSVGRGQQDIIVVLGLLAGGFCFWRWWQKRQESQGKPGKRSSQSEAASHKGKKPGESGYASAFSFDSKKGKGGKKELPSALEALPLKQPAPAPAPAHKPKGNPKKDKSVKAAKKASKEAKAKEGRETEAIGTLIASRAKAKGIADAGKEPEVGLHTVVDYSKTEDAFHNVQQWQESGKKNFRK